MKTMGGAGGAFERVKRIVEAGTVINQKNFSSKVMPWTGGYYEIAITMKRVLKRFTVFIQAGVVIKSLITEPQELSLACR